MDIFEYTAFCLQCEYVSDLRSVRVTHTQAVKIYTLPEDMFSLSAYNQLAEYVTGKHVQFPCTAEAKEAIVQSLLFSPV